MEGCSLREGDHATVYQRPTIDLGGDPARRTMDANGGRAAGFAADRAKLIHLGLLVPRKQPPSTDDDQDSTVVEKRADGIRETA